MPSATLSGTTLHHTSSRHPQILSPACVSLLSCTDSSRWPHAIYSCHRHSWNRRSCPCPTTPLRPIRHCALFFSIRRLGTTKDLDVIFPTFWIAFRSLVQCVVALLVQIAQMQILPWLIAKSDLAKVVLNRTLLILGRPRRRCCGFGSTRTRFHVNLVWFASRLKQASHPTQPIFT